MNAMATLCTIFTIFLSVHPKLFKKNFFKEDENWLVPLAQSLVTSSMLLLVLSIHWLPCWKVMTKLPP